MLSLTTGQVHDLLVSFTHDYHGYEIRSIRVHDDIVSIGCVDLIGSYHRVDYNIKTSVEFVKKDA